MSSANLSRQTSSVAGDSTVLIKSANLSERLLVTSSPVTTPVAWANAMSYERVEFVSILHEWLRLRVFERDDITIQESSRYFCSVGLPPTQEHVLCLSGKAARTREPLYLKLVRHIRHTMVSDLEVDVRFGTQIGDRLPFGLRVSPLAETPHLRASRYWRRAFWAMRAGIVRKIAETRAMAQQRINASSGPASSSAAKRQAALYRPAPPKPPAGPSAPGSKESFRFVPSSAKPPIPMSMYHTECAASSIDLDRLTLNAPTLLVVWASWDAPSLAWLEEYVFPVGGGGVLGRAAGSEGQLPASADPWVSLLKKYLFVPEKTTWASVMALRGRPAKQRTVSPHTTADSSAPTAPPAPASDATDDPGVPSLCKRGNIVLINIDSDFDAASAAMQDFQRRSRFWTSSDVSLSSTWAGPSGMQSELAVSLDVHHLPMILACDPPERAGAASIVKELDAGELAREAIRRRSSMRRKVSPPVNSSSESALATSAVSRLGLPMWHDVPRAERERLLGVIASTVSAHDAPLVLESVVSVEYPAMNEDNDQVNAYEMESDLIAYGIKSSSVSLRGTCCRTVIFGDAGKSIADAATNVPAAGGLPSSPIIVSAVRDAIYAIAKRVRNSEVKIETFAPSTPLVFTFDELTPEHRIKGAYWSLTCGHCRRSVRTEREAHYRCLHCVPSRHTICCECYESRVHAAHHVCVKLRRDTSQLVQSAPLWGTSNVGVLPAMHGRVLTSTSSVHHDAICNGCKQLIDGTRWKCCCCHEFELCAKCEGAWWHSVVSATMPADNTTGRGDKGHKDGWAKSMLAPPFAGAPPHMASASTTKDGKSGTSASAVPLAVLEHPAGHYMLHIRAPLVGEASSFLHPTCDTLEL